MSVGHIGHMVVFAIRQGKRQSCHPDSSVHVLFSRDALSDQGAFSERCHTHGLIRASRVCYSAAGHGGEIATMSDFSFFELVGGGDL